ncbi:DUF3341 domain-containing protein [Rhodopila sp.]|uniref:DUF3341 domain-containing protein n=1 Tax=Rhodopila sp. TaxID=2480087 RepID=UPI003D0F5A66
MAEAGTEAEAPLWGVSAEFGTPEAVLNAARVLRGRGLGRLDIFSPVPLPDAADVLGLPRRAINPFALAGALMGGAAMMGMCLYATGFDYVFNIGGRPRFSWPAFVIPSFSFGMMVGALVVLLVMLVQSRLPRLNHHAFNIPSFTRASQDRFFLVVMAGEKDFNANAVERVLTTLAVPPLVISQVPR